MSDRVPRAGFWGVSVLVLFAGTSFAGSEGDEFFETRIRPLLADKCFGCHTKEALGGLRLDSRENILKGGDLGPAIVPGKPDESLLIQAVRHLREDLLMPMGGEKLSEQQIADLAHWIEIDAPWPDVKPGAEAASVPGDLTDEEKSFWSFRPLARPDVPKPIDAEWARTDIDRFVKAKLENEGLEPVSRASRHDLIRRVSFDVTGLPPSPEEVEAFVNDESADAYEKVVDRLLASPHYGEFWGRHWLDVARYGEDDTRGLAEDGEGREVYGSAYVYRDWVIQALNDDMSYDLFVKSQLAGDLLGKDLESKAIGGLGFLGGGPWYYDIADPAVARADERHDRVDVTTRGFLGLTVACARCHDHKFDPITTQDYYGLAGVFYNTIYNEYPVVPDTDALEYKKQKDYIDALKKELEDYLKVEREQLARVLALQSSRYMVAAWKVKGEPGLTIAEAANEERLDLETLERWIRFLAKEPKHYPYLKDWQAMIASGGTPEEAQKLAESFQRFLMEINAEKKKIKEKNEWIIANGSPPPEERKSVPMPNDFKSFFDEHQLELQFLEREKFNLWNDIFAYDLDGNPDFYNFDPGLLVFQKWALERRLSPVSLAHVEALRAEIRKLEEALPKQFRFVMGVKDKPPEQIEDLGLHIRGNPQNLGAKVPRRFPAVLSETAPVAFTSGSGRLELAEAIARHPLTARVIVNRVWRWHFGSGLSETPSNFGRLGDRPRDPELLEFLASWFVENGMSLKKLHREILLSSTYQLSTAQSKPNFARDPDNRLYWRANRRRLDAESIRDAILFVSGGLDPELFGSSADLSDPENRRRTVYGRVSRFRLDDYLQTFDFPNPGISAEKRFTTTVPLQSLYFMNSPFVEQEAKRLVYRLAEREPEAGEKTPAAPEDLSWLSRVSDEEKIRRAYRRLYGREVLEDELSSGLAFLSAAPREGRTALDRWTQYARVLLGANEFRFVD
jgi:cytochrome c553